MSFKTIITALATTLAVSACSDFDDVLSSQSTKGSVPEGGTPVATTFGASGEEMQNDVISRTTLASDKKTVLWEENDMISVFDTPLSNRAFKLSTGAGSSKATFTGEAVSAMKYYAIYPVGSGEYSDTEGIVDNVQLMGYQPTPQTSAPASTIPVKKMMAEATSDTNTFLFKNVTARLDFNMTGFGSTVAHTSIYFVANGAETLAGTGTLDWNGGDPKFIDFNQNTALPYVYDPASNFSSTSYMYINPGVLESGYTICLHVDYNDRPGANFYYHSNDRKVYVRNKVYTFNLSPTKANGIGSVDLGLPSGMLVDAMNLGALSPLQAGNQYAFGETETKDSYEWTNYKFGRYMMDFTKYLLFKDAKDFGENGFYDGKGVLDASDDVAYILSKGVKHIPSENEGLELANNVTVSQIMIDGSKAYKLTSKINGKSVIVPATKDMYNKYEFRFATSSAYNSNVEFKDQRFAISGDNGIGLGVISKASGAYIRAVQPKDKHAYVDMGAAGKWATVNVGAIAPEGFGDYYAWGDVTPNNVPYSWTNYKFGTLDHITKYTGESVQYSTTDDPATSAWGSEWRTPTKAQFQALID